MTSASVAPPPPWRARIRAQWQLVRDTARLVGPSARLLTGTDVHTYAYSVSANCLLASMPFLFLMLWVGNHLFPALPNQDVISRLLYAYLPAGQQQMMAHAVPMAQRHTVQVFSLVMLAISSSGVFLPLEVALNDIWKFPKNRGYLGNQIVSLLLVLACGIVAYSAIALAAMGRYAVTGIFPARWTGVIEAFTSIFLAASAIPAAILIFFLIYWLLPNGPVPRSQVFPAAFYTGLLADGFLHLFRWFAPLLDFRGVYGTLSVAVTLIVWGYGGALLLLFGASLSARGVARLPEIHFTLSRSRHIEKV